MALAEAPRLPRQLLLLAAMLVMVAVTCAGEEEGDVDDSDHPHFDTDADDDYDEEHEKMRRSVCFTVQPPTLQRVPKCCPGWEFMNRLSTEGLPICQAVCIPACVNATCKEPNVCDCLAHHTKKIGSPRHVCSPQCYPPCVNGECVGMNECRCKPGYARAKSASHVCQPEGGILGGVAGEDGDLRDRLQICFPQCGEFSRCVGFNECACDAGFERNPARPGHCRPSCRPPCGAHAVCARPGTCKCLPGYSLHGNGSCVAKCDGGCANGVCVAPNVCECIEGFEKLAKLHGDQDDVCVPECAPPCGDHGDCIKTDTCVCDKGYELSFEGDCVVICRPGTFWYRGSGGCIPFPTTPSKQTPRPPQPSPPPTRPRPRQTTTPRHTTSKKISKSPLPPSAFSACTLRCVNGICGTNGSCECSRGWAGANCSRPCALLSGSTEFNASDCPALKKCSCLWPTDGGRSCMPDTDPKCEQSELTSNPSSEMPQWLVWTIAGSIVGALLLFVVVPSAVAMQLRHNKQRRRSGDRDALHTNWVKPEPVFSRF